MARFEYQLRSLHQILQIVDPATQIYSITLPNIFNKVIYIFRNLIAVSLTQILPVPANLGVPSCLLIFIPKRNNAERSRIQGTAEMNRKTGVRSRGFF
jgi:hypothetical protein